MQPSTDLLLARLVDLMSVRPYYHEPCQARQDVEQFVDLLEGMQYHTAQVSLW